MKIITKKYEKDGTAVVWKPAECIQSSICFQGLSDVFDPNKRPWENMAGASTAKIVEQVKRCPSGALSKLHGEQ